MKYVYVLNSWYDGLVGKHETLRFSLFILPMMGALVMIGSDNQSVQMIGLFVLISMTVLRTLPIFFPGVGNDR
jgi:hypothetical protein